MRRRLTIAIVGMVAAAWSSPGSEPSPSRGQRPRHQADLRAQVETLSDLLTELTIAPSTR